MVFSTVNRKYDLFIRRFAQFYKKKHPQTKKIVKQTRKVPSDVEVAPRYKLLTLLTLLTWRTLSTWFTLLTWLTLSIWLTLLTLLTLFSIQIAQHCSNISIYDYIYC